MHFLPLSIGSNAARQFASVRVGAELTEKCTSSFLHFRDLPFKTGGASVKASRAAGSALGYSPEGAS
jgi:hypothetical protein